MEKRSLSRMFLLDIVTLGLYELYWLAQTRREMVTKHQAKIPCTGYVLLVKALQLVGFIAVVSILFYFIPAASRNYNNSFNKLVKPPATCYIDYNQNAACKEAVDKYLSLPSDWAIPLVGLCFLIIVAMGVAYTLFLRRWVAAYATAVQKVTGNALPATVSVVSLGGTLPLLGMIYVQKAFNEI